MSQKTASIVVPVVLDQRQWAGLQSEADLASRLFGHPITAEDIVQVRATRWLGARRPAAAGAP
jgi:hypothetical protein